MNNLVIPKELFTSFKEVTYFDDPHKYYINGDEYISVTTLIHEYVDPFKEDYWSNYKANQHRLTQTQILRGWNLELATDFGRPKLEMADKDYPLICLEEDAIWL